MLEGPFLKEEIVLINAFAERLGEIVKRKWMEDELKKHNDQLEFLVEERTFELKKANEQLYREIAERKLVEEALKDSEERYRRLIELSPNGVAIHSEGKFLFINNAGTKLLGAEKPDELIGRSILDFVHPDYQESCKQRVSQILNEKKQMSLLEQRLLRLDGTVIDAEFSGIPFNYKERLAVEIVFRDITERKRAEEALRLSEERFSKAFNANPSSMTISTLDEGRFIDVNDSFLKMLGYEGDDVIGLTVFD